MFRKRMLCLILVLMMTSTSVVFASKVEPEPGALRPLRAAQNQILNTVGFHHNQFSYDNTNRQYEQQVITDKDLITFLSKQMEQDGFEIDDGSVFYFDTAIVSDGEQIRVLCLRKRIGDSIEDTMLVPFVYNEDEDVQVIDASTFIQKTLDSTNRGMKNSGSYTIGKAYVTGYYNKTIHNSAYYYQPYQLSYKVTSSVTVISGLYRIAGSPYTLNYGELDQMDYPNYAITKTTGSPTVGTTYSQYSVCPRRYKFIGALSMYHEIGVRFSSSGVYTMRDLDMSVFV